MRKRISFELSAILLILLLDVLPALALDPTTLPTGGRIVSGAGGISQSGSAMSVNQATERMIANWNTFNIGRDASVTFKQPASSSVA